MTDWPNPNTNPEFYDPFAEPDRHPILPCGLNSVAMDGDEVNGAGINFAIWPMLFDTYEGFEPIVLTADKIAVFDECPDVKFGAPDNDNLIPNIERTTELRHRWIPQEIPGQNNTMMFEPWENTLIISRRSNLVQLPPDTDGVALTAQKEMEVTE
jgi:hypothetical protein